MAEHLGPGLVRTCGGLTSLGLDGACLHVSCPVWHAKDCGTPRGSGPRLSASSFWFGAAASHIPEDVQSAHPEMPWHLMRAMRNRLVHVYFSVDPTVVWDTVDHELLPRVPLLEALVRDCGDYEAEHWTSLRWGSSRATPGRRLSASTSG